jgi:tRNA (cmo5U34)-methyltransferase
MSDRAIETFSAFAADYEASRRLMIEPYDLFYDTTVAALGLARRPVERVLELGAGTGVLTRRIRDAFPNAELLVTDGSEAMLERNRGTISGDVRHEMLDLRSELPAGPFDAVVSAMAIHHLTHDDQQQLYRRTHEALAEGGVFVNGEVVAGAGPFTIEAYQQWHERSVRARGGHDHDWHAYLARQEADVCAPLADHLRWLEASGFAEADCLFKQYLYAVLVAVR